MQVCRLTLARKLSTGSQKLGRYVSENGELNADVKRKLMDFRVNGKDLEAHPEKGWIFMKEKIYREFLNETFGADNWELRAHEPFQLNWMSMTRVCGLYVEDTLVTTAKGEIPLNERIVKDLESLYKRHISPKSEPLDRTELQREICEIIPETLTRWTEFVALLRCCKEIGLAAELWDRITSQKLLESECIRVNISGIHYPDYATYKLRGQPSLNFSNANRNPPKTQSSTQANSGGRSETSPSPTPARLKYFWRRRDAKPYADELTPEV